MIEKLVDLPIPVELRGLAVGPGGSIERCTPTLPMTFGFEWHGARFAGTVAREDNRLVLSLGAALAQVPFSAENAKRRGTLLALATATESEDHVGPALTVSKSGELRLKQQIALKADAALTATNLVTETTAAVLSTAPLLDLIVETGLIAPAG